MVDEDSLILTNDHKKRFARAMRFLDLKPYLHPSQFMQEVSASSSEGLESDDNLLGLFENWSELESNVKDMLYEEIGDRIKSK